MLQFEKLKVSYDGHVVLENFSLQVGAGEIVALVGESGSGKTTVVRAAMGLLSRGGQIDEGEILLDGKSLLTMGEKQRRGRMGTEMSMIFQDSGSMLNPVRTIGSQFVEFIQTHEKITKKEAREKVKDQLRKVGLPHVEILMETIPDDLSGGMRQRVGIALAMTYTPKILLADEPTSALDVTIQAQIVSLLKTLRQKEGTSIIIVTHNLAVASYLADRIMVMKEGRIVEEGEGKNLLKEPQHEYTKKLITAIPDIKKSYYQ